MVSFTSLRIFPIAWFTFLEAVRNRVLWLVILSSVISLAIGWFFSNAALTESMQIQTVVVAALGRFMAVFILSIFVISSIAREQENKGLDFLLAFPITRSDYFLGKLIGFALLAFFATVLFCLPLSITTEIIHLIYWGISLFCELLIVIGFSFFCVLGLRHIPLAVFATMGFYVLSRSMNAITLMAANPTLGTGDMLQQGLNGLVTVIAHTLPSLDVFTVTSWLVYATSDGLQLFTVLGQSIVYVTLLAAASLFELYRKEL